MSWPDPDKGCQNEATERLVGLAPGDQTTPRGMKVTVCEEHRAVYVAAGWRPEEEVLGL